MIVNEKGERIPAETVLTLPEDLMSDQGIDYILQLLPKGIYDGFDKIVQHSSLIFQIIFRLF